MNQPPEFKPSIDPDNIRTISELKTYVFERMAWYDSLPEFWQELLGEEHTAWVLEINVWAKNKLKELRNIQ